MKPRIFGALIHSSDRYVSLMGSLMILLVAYPIMEGLGRLDLYGAVVVFQLVVGVYSIGDSKKHLLTAAGLCLPGLALHLVALFHPSRLILLIGDGTVAIFFIYVIIIVYRAVLSETDFDQNTIAGAVSVYLLLGIFWSVLYSMVSKLQPESFAFLHESGDFGYSSSGQFLYFSFVTLTTLGYGDISPDTTLSQTLAWMEAVAGQLFVAVTVATLVGIRVAHYRGEARDRRKAG